ncbi:hypothetical protein D8M40_12255, partial [Corynebacterium propinquum]
GFWPFGACVEVMINCAVRRLIQFQVGSVWRVGGDFEHVCCTCVRANTFSLLNERVAAVRRLVDRGTHKAGVPEGALRTATIKYRQEHLIDEAHALHVVTRATKPYH